MVTASQHYHYYVLALLSTVVRYNVVKTKQILTECHPNFIPNRCNAHIKHKNMSMRRVAPILVSEFLNRNPSLKLRSARHLGEVALRNLEDGRDRRPHITLRAAELRLTGLGRNLHERRLAVVPALHFFSR